MSQAFRKNNNLIGQKYGRWTILEFSPNDKRESYWLCECSCIDKTQRIVQGTTLKNGKSQSCGCLNREIVSKIATKDLIGQTFGRLTVIEKTERRYGTEVVWRCQCNCTEQTICEVGAGNLKNGHTKSCGCLAKEVAATRYIDLLHRKFGRLTVIEKTDDRKDNQVVWKCRCDCNEDSIVYVIGSNLTRGNTQSCGCLRNEIRSKVHSSNLLGQTFGLLTVIEKTDMRKDNRIVWKCQCNCKEKNIHYVNTSDLVSGNTSSCGCIGTSVGEFYIKNLLSSNNFSFDKEYKFPELYYISKQHLLRFDFIIFKDNYFYLIEFDGEQHFKTTSRHDQDEVNKIKEKDKLKNQYCLDNNIPLIRIPFWERNNITIDILKLETTPKKYVVKTINHNEEIYEEYLYKDGN